MSPKFLIFFLSPLGRDWNVTIFTVITKGATNPADNERGHSLPSWDDFGTTGNRFSDAPGIQRTRNPNGSVNGMADKSKNAPSHSNKVVGQLSYDRSSEGFAQEHESDWEPTKSKNRSGGGCRQSGDGIVDRSPEAPGGIQQQRQRQPLLRSDSDRAILGRVDYGAVKRDLR